MKDFSVWIHNVYKKYQTVDPRTRWMGLGCVVLLVLFVPGLMTSRAPQAVVSLPENVGQEQPEQANYFIGDEIDKKAYVQRLEGQYFDLQQQNEKLSAHFDELGQKLNDVLKAQGRTAVTVSSLEQRMNDVISRAAVSPVEGTGPVLDVRGYKLELMNINPVKQGEEGTAYLPPGSFVRATLLTGVYAPADATNPLPVLIRLNEAFTGPNAASIPLQGAFAIGKAAGDLASERALVQITTMAAVFSTGATFEHKGNIGYLTDAAGQLGLKGVVVRNTGGQMAMSFMTGFLGGASQALADAQTTTVTAENGHVSRNVTGSRARNAAFQGMAQSAGQMSRYYENQLERIVPAIKVDAGVEVYFIVLEGVKIHGLKKADLPVVRFMD